MIKLLTYLSEILNSWFLENQDIAIGSTESVIEPHDTIFFFIIMVCIAVIWVLGTTIINYFDTGDGDTLAKRFQNYGTATDVFWMKVPLIILSVFSYFIMHLVQNPALIMDEVVAVGIGIPETPPCSIESYNIESYNHNEASGSNSESPEKIDESDPNSEISDANKETNDVGSSENNSNGSNSSESSYENDEFERYYVETSDENFKDYLYYYYYSDEHDSSWFYISDSESSDCYSGSEGYYADRSEKYEESDSNSESSD